MTPTPEQKKKRLQKMVKYSDNKDIAIVENFSELEENIDATSDDIKKTVLDVKDEIVGAIKSIEIQNKEIEKRDILKPLSLSIDISGEELKKTLGIKDGKDAEPVNVQEIVDKASSIVTKNIKGSIPKSSDIEKEIIAKFPDIKKLEEKFDSKIANTQSEIEAKIPSKSEFTLIETKIVKQIPTKKEIEENVRKEIPNLSEPIRDSLESLKGEDRLDISAIQGLDDYDTISKLAREPRVVKKYYGSGGSAESGGGTWEGLTGDQSTINISGFTNDSGYITSGALNGYAKLDASNQPFTGNLNILKGSPRYTATENVDNATAYFEKLPTLNEGRFVSQQRPYIADGAVTTSIANNGGTFSNTLSNWSISFWIKTTHTGQNMFAGNTANNTTLLVYHEAGSFNLRVSGSTVSWAYPSATLGNNTWTHVVYAIAKNASSQLYVNGTSLGNVTAPNADAVFTHILRGGTSSLSNGTFDEYIVFNSQIDSTKVASLYNAGFPAKLTDYTGVYAAFHFDTGSGSTYFDGSGNGRNATATTAPTWTTGIVTSGAQALEDVPLVRMKNNNIQNSYGDLTIGYYSGVKNPRLFVESSSFSFTNLGTEYFAGSQTAFTLGASTTINGSLTIATNNNLSMGAGSGRFYVGSVGSTAAPAISNISDTNSGFNFGTDIISMVTGGTERANISASGIFRVGAGTAGNIPSSTSANFTALLSSVTTSGSAGMSVSVNDGTRNGRAGLFFNDTDGIWGLSHSYTSTRRPFVLISNTTEQLRVDTNHNLGVGVVNIRGRGHFANNTAVATHNAPVVVNNLNAGTGGVGTGPYTGIDFSHLNDNASDIQRKMAIGFEKTTTNSRGDMIISLNGVADNSNVNYLTDEKLRLTMDGFMGIGTIGTTITAMLDINSDVIRLRTAKTPASATATGNQGDICWDANYIYVATATNTWKRVAIATW